MERSERDGWDKAWSQATTDDELGTLAYPWVRPALEFVARHAPVGSRVLEAGCGLGRFVHWLTEQGRFPVGLDISGEGLGAIRKRWPDYTIVQADVRRLPFRDEAFDACLSFGVIEHFTEGSQVCLAEMRRVLAPEGVLVLCVPHLSILDRLRPGLHRAYRALRRMRKVGPSEPPGRPYRLGELKGALDGSGFAAIEAMPFGHAYAFHSLCRCFRRQGSYHDITPLGLRLGRVMERVAPWAGASTLFVAAVKRPSAER
jgi:SAM-dependent methyltransferase